MTELARLDAPKQYTAIRGMVETRDVDGNPSGDYVLASDYAALRDKLAAAESRLAEMEGMREEFGNVLREHGLSDLGIARVYDRLADAARAAREQGRG